MIFAESAQFKRNILNVLKQGGGGALHFKTKLLEIGKLFCILNSMYIIYNDYFIWMRRLFQIFFLLYPTEVIRLKCAMLGAFTVHLRKIFI